MLLKAKLFLYSLVVALVRKRGFFASGSFQAQNWAGRNQKLGADVQFNQRGLLFDVNFTDPWIAGDSYRTSYTVNGFKGNILANKLRGSYSLYLPTRLTRFTAGCRQPNSKSEECPQAFAFNVQA